MYSSHKVDILVCCNGLGDITATDKQHNIRIADLDYEPYFSASFIENNPYFLVPNQEVPIDDRTEANCSYLKGKP